MTLHSSIRHVLGGAAVAAVAAFSMPAASAGQIVLPDIGTFSSYSTSNTAQTFTGNGFVGEYPGEWAHLLGVEITDYSRTLIQVNISSLTTPPPSASLSFLLLDGDSGPHDVMATGFGGTGHLTYSWDAPLTNYGSSSIAAFAGLNTIDVTGILDAAVLSGNHWLNILLQGTDSNGYMWTYTDWPHHSPDRAQLRLSAPGLQPVPEPLTLSLIGAGFAGVFAAGRKRKNSH